VPRLSGSLLAAAALCVRSIAGAPALESAAAPGDELPDGKGKAILRASCTSCHDLTEVTKLKGFYTREQWRDVVATMVEYGAEIDKDAVEVLVEYLTEHLGRRPQAGVR
jgi:cytochrome c5